MKIDPVVRRETSIIALGALIQVGVLQLVFLALGKWWFGVLLSSLLVGAVGVLHFFTLGLTVQRALKLTNEDERNRLMKASQMAQDMDFINNFLGRMLNAVRCPVAREMPDNMKDKLDTYLCRKRAK